MKDSTTTNAMELTTFTSCADMFSVWSAAVGLWCYVRVIRSGCTLLTRCIRVTCLPWCGWCFVGAYVVVLENGNARATGAGSLGSYE